VAQRPVRARQAGVIDPDPTSQDGEHERKERAAGRKCAENLHDTPTLVAVLYQGNDY
jgi:hypothetical protein